AIFWVGVFSRPRFRARSSERNFCAPKSNGESSRFFANRPRQRRFHRRFRRDRATPDSDSEMNLERLLSTLCLQNCSCFCANVIGANTLRVVGSGFWTVKISPPHVGGALLSPRSEVANCLISLSKHAQ